MMKKFSPAIISNVILKVFFFFAFPAAWSAGFAGIKDLCQQLSTGEPIKINAFLLTPIALLCFTVVFGRFFCSKACAFGTYGDALYHIGVFIARKLKKRPLSLPPKAASAFRYIKYFVLTAICLLCFFGFSSIVSEGSPWTSFSHIIAGSMNIDDAIDTISLILFLLCSAGMVLERRFFCRFLCPFGAVFTMMPVLPFSTAGRKRSECIENCRACEIVCVASLKLPDTGASDSPAAKSDPEPETHSHMGECFQCGRCAQVCPRRNAGCLTMPPARMSVIADWLKAFALAGLLYWVM